MPLYEKALIVFGALLVPLAFMQVMMRRQLHDPNYGIGPSKVSAWDVRFVYAMFRRYGICNLHKKPYQCWTVRLTVRREPSAERRNHQSQFTNHKSQIKNPPVSGWVLLKAES